MYTAFQNPYEEIDYFQLSSEDMDLVGTNQQLRDAIVESDQLEITGDLGEGMQFAEPSACDYNSNVVYSRHHTCCLNWVLIRMFQNTTMGAVVGIHGNLI